MNTKYNIGQEVPIVKQTTKTVTETKRVNATIKSISIGPNGAKYTVSDGNTAYTELELEEFAKPEPVVAPVEDKPHEYKVGDSTRATAGTHIGEIGKIVKIDKTSMPIKVEFSNGDAYWYTKLQLEPYAAPSEPEQKKEPIKLYCFKDNQPGHRLTKGKFYEFNGCGITYDNGFCSYINKSFEEWKSGNREYASCLVEAVKRPAKMDEYVLIHDSIAFGVKNRDICKVIALTNDGSGYIYVRSNSNSRYLGSSSDREIKQPFSLLSEKEYLVLENYTPEEPKEEYYNGKVVCTESTDIFHTVGKIYPIKDGFINVDSGPVYNLGSPIITLKEFNERQPDKFIFYKGEA